MFYLFAGRQTDLGVGADTAQQRIQLWSESLKIFRGAPLFGIGYRNLAEQMGQVAHNSFMHTFAELGFFGGVMFLGAFAIAFRSLQTLGADKSEPRNEELARFRPYLMAIVAGQAAGMMSLSRAYVIPTYLVLGMAAAYMRIVQNHSPITVPTFGTRMLTRLAVLGMMFLAGMFFFVRGFVNWG
jgi:O-antigen ligase